MTTTLCLPCVSPNPPTILMVSFCIFFLHRWSSPQKRTTISARHMPYLERIETRGSFDKLAQALLSFTFIQYTGTDFSQKLKTTSGTSHWNKNRMHYTSPSVLVYMPRLSTPIQVQGVYIFNHKQAEIDICCQLFCSNLHNNWHCIYVCDIIGTLFRRETSVLFFYRNKRS